MVSSGVKSYLVICLISLSYWQVLGLPQRVRTSEMVPVDAMESIASEMADTAGSMPSEMVPADAMESIASEMADAAGSMPSEMVPVDAEESILVSEEEGEIGCFGMCYELDSNGVCAVNMECIVKLVEANEAGETAQPACSSGSTAEEPAK